MIDKILNAKTIQEIVDVSNYKSSCNNIIKQIHPDVCKDSRCSEAFIKFRKLQKKYELGFKFIDDAGAVILKGNEVVFDGMENAIKYSNALYKILYKTSKFPVFKDYIPVSFNKNKIVAKTPIHSLINLTLPEEHVRWILNRLLEFSAYMENLGYVHGGLNLESVFIQPEIHCITVGSFYHTVKIGEKISTISAKYKRFYPSEIFIDKKAITKTDIELSKRIACILLGDSSGVGIKLKKTNSSVLVDFLLKVHSNAFEAMDEYKKLLTNNFENKFYKLEI